MQKKPVHNYDSKNELVANKLRSGTTKNDCNPLKPCRYTQIKASVTANMGTPEMYAHSP